MTAINCISNGSVLCLANHRVIKSWVEMGQTNVYPDARLPLRLLTPSRTIFRTLNRKYIAKKHQSEGRTDVLR